MSPQCARCTGKGSIKVAARDELVSCPVCLGLGRFDVNQKYKRPPPTHDQAVVHSDIPIEDVIDMLPEVEPDNE